eukprot:Hpha_TRINITY_DN16612_c0_g5::TRINITY_DN16612_c0_g5_i1::g.181612::m.181612
MSRRQAGLAGLSSTGVSRGIRGAGCAAIRQRPSNPRRSSHRGTGLGEAWIGARRKGVSRSASVTSTRPEPRGAMKMGHEVDDDDDDDDDGAGAGAPAPLISRASSTATLGGGGGGGGGGSGGYAIDY